MATTITSPNTNDVVNWAYQYTLACNKLTAAQNEASYSATRSEDIAAAKADFNATMKSLVPEEAQTSVQFQYMDALTAYQAEMGAADSYAERAAASRNLTEALSAITLPDATSTTLEDLATANKTQVSNALANIKSMASNAGTAWLEAAASGASALDAKSATATESLKTLLESLGMDTADVTTPTYSTKAVSTFAAASAAAATNGTPGSIMNAALIGYLVADQAATSSDTS